MLAVRCPECKKLLRLNRPVENARLRCRFCGYVFVGSTKEYPDKRDFLSKHSSRPLAASQEPVEMEPAGSTAAPMGHEHVHVRHRRNSVIPLIVVIVGFLAIIAAVILASHLYRNPEREIRDDTGALLWTGRATDAEYERLLRKYKGLEDTTDQPPPTPPTPPPPPTPPHGGTGDVYTPPGAAPKTPVTPSGGGETVVDERPKFQADPKLPTQVDNKPVTSDVSPNSGDIVGAVKNNYPYPLQSVMVHVYTYDEDNQRRPPIAVTCSFLPPGGTARFSAHYRGLDSDQIHRISAVAHSPQRAAQNVVAWEIDPNAITRSQSGRAVVLTGTAKNSFSHPVHNVRIHYNFYDTTGVQVGRTARSTGLEGAAEHLAPGQEAKFTIKFFPTDVSASLVGQWVVRAWANK